MKTLVFSIALSTLFFAACNNGTTNNESTKEPSSAANNQKAPAAPGSPTEELVNDYLQLKDALAKDNDKDAAAAGNKMVKAFNNFDKTSLTPEQAKVYNDIEEDAKEHAEHIGANAGNIEHQREHFETLSEEIYELVKSAGAGQKLYYTHCPMYNNNKGANWLSGTKEIQNPYLGQAMSTCGTVKEELN
ncbi:hypothetical protein BCY91_06285 [Pelobium manganitolerans]|uniref:DUF3347 domain-containing protein n=1 Tax=Pelobium manganitolerans TaxID=1842495 RepID=A0A419S4T8_9SPHI|nr:DUF3347 domain-containing protein [Pelobium manganitolerans]RKD15126.1 hypothetical protein BCY91_06285 [Pelobium manganitolerans]